MSVRHLALKITIASITYLIHKTKVLVRGQVFTIIWVCGTMTTETW